MIEFLRSFAKQIKQELLTLYFVAKSPETSWYIKILALIVVAYALSPVDLIPDFIPILGYLDDLILVPLGMAVVLRLTPKEVLAASREQARAEANKRLPKSIAAGIFIVAIWIGTVVAAWFFFWNRTTWHR